MRLVRTGRENHEAVAAATASCVINEKSGMVGLIHRASRAAVRLPEEPLL